MNGRKAKKLRKIMHTYLTHGQDPNAKYFREEIGKHEDMIAAANRNRINARKTGAYGPGHPIVTHFPPPYRNPYRQLKHLARRILA